MLKQSDFKEVSLTGDGPPPITKSAEAVAKGLGISRASVMDGKAVKERYPNRGGAGRCMKPKRRRCKFCRQPFLAVRSDAKTCSPKCRPREHRRRLSVSKKMKHLKAHFSSQTDLWSTPQDDLCRSRPVYSNDGVALPNDREGEKKTPGR